MFLVVTFSKSHYIPPTPRLQLVAATTSLQLRRPLISFRLAIKAKPRLEVNFRPHTDVVSCLVSISSAEELDQF